MSQKEIIPSALTAKKKSPYSFKYTTGVYKGYLIPDLFTLKNKTFHIVRLLKRCIQLKLKVHIIGETLPEKLLLQLRATGLDISCVDAENIPDFYSNIQIRPDSLLDDERCTHNVLTRFKSRTSVAIFLSADAHISYVLAAQRRNIITIGFTDGTSEAIKLLDYCLLIKNPHDNIMFTAISHIISRLRDFKKVQSKKRPLSAEAKEKNREPQEDTKMAPSSNPLKDIKVFDPKEKKNAQILSRTLAELKEIVRKHVEFAYEALARHREAQKRDKKS